MRLLKLVPDNTNIDFMRWRNLALILSILRHRRRDRSGRSPAASISASISSAARASASPSPSRRDLDELRDRVNGLGHGEADPPGIRLAQRDLDPHAAARRRRGGREPRPRARSARRSPSAIPTPASTRSRRSRARSRRNCSDRARSAIAARDARHRHLHLDPVRMAVRRRRAGHPVPRRLDDAGLLLADPARVQPQRRRRDPDHRRLFAERHRRHLRPHPRESAQIPQDGDRAAAQPLAQRDAVAHDGDQHLDPARAAARCCCSGRT